MNLAVIGTHWGDEGKGKVVDLLADRFDVVARFQGGHNAGHSVATDEGCFAFHLIPTGILRRHQTCVIGNGVVLDPSAFLSEVAGLRERGVAVDGGRLLVSDRAHVIASWHRAYERASEARKKLGTTLRGIGPAYASKAERSGLRVIDLLNHDRLESKLQAILATTNERLAGYEWFESLEVAREAKLLAEQGEALRPFVCDTSLYLHEQMSAGKSVLFEGAQATLLDVDHGTYPYVTSSSSSAGGIASGLGIGPTKVDAVLGVSKAYTTRVGEGPMPTELKGAAGDHLRERGNEYGVSTGRPRRCGWYDAVAGRYAVRVNGITIVALTLMDVLDELEEIPVAVAYRTADGERLTEYPADTSVLYDVEVEYEKLAGWRKNLTAIRSYDELPAEAKRYVERLEQLIGSRVGVISVGADRRQTIVREELFASWPKKAG